MSSGTAGRYGRVQARVWDSPDPLISVVTLNWNGLADTLACLDSLSCVSYPNLDVWVVDNGSSDGSVETILARFPVAKLIANPTNLGFSGGINLGIRSALDGGADYVFLLNNDTIIAPDAIGWLRQAMQRDANAGVSVPKIVYYANPDRIWSAGARWMAFPPRVKLIGYGRPSTDSQYDRPYSLDYVTGCALLVSRRTFEAVGLFDELFFMYQEDYDFSRRVRLAGLDMLYEPRAIVRHKVSGGLGENSARKWYFWSKSSVVFYLKHFSAASLAVFAAWVVARETAKGNIGILPAIFRGLVDGFALWRRGREV